MSDFPYPGLRPFLRDETDIFFGREEQIDQLLERLDEARFLAIVGPSGCGKSSLVKAGLIAALETGFLASAGARWRIASMRPGGAPLTALAEALCSERALGRELGSSATEAVFLLANLRRGPLGLVESVEEAGLAAGTNLLLLVDQFEEIFRYTGEDGEDEAEAFVAMLLATVQDAECPIYVVLTMRSDFLGDCTRFHGLPEAMNDSQFLTPRLSREQLRSCIAGPAGVFGGSVDPALANRLLNDMGADPDQLPLMQHALMRMWLRASGTTTGIIRVPDSFRRTLSSESDGVSMEEATPSLPAGAGGDVELGLEDYEAVGTLAEALSNHADAAFESLDEEGQRIAEKMFRCLSERGSERRDTRRPTRLAEVAAVAGVSAEKVIEVVEVFRQPGRSFVTPPAGLPLDETSILDISHESLIRQWDNMSGWVEAEARSGETYRRLEETARLWKRHLAAPWRRPDLDLALTWKALEQPTLEWSKRYGTDFELAMEFLDESERERVERHQRREAARQHELEQAKALAEAEKRKAEAEHRLAQEQATVIQRLRKFSVALGLTALAAVVGVVLALVLLSNIKARDRMLTESRLSNRAILTLESDPTLAILLAAEARHDVDPAEASEEIALQETTLLRVLSGVYSVESPAGSDEGVLELAFTPACESGEWLAVIDRHGDAGLWRASNLSEAPVGLGGLRDLAFSPDCRWMTTLDDGGTLSVRPAGDLSGAPLHELEAREGAADLLYSPQGRWLAAVAPSGVDLWDVRSADPQTSALRIEGRASRIAFSPDDRQLAVVDVGTVTLWDLEGSVRRRATMRHDKPVSGLAFSPPAEQRWLATASGSTAYIWDLQAADPGARPRPLGGHRELITDVAFSPDPEADDYWLATASLDESIRLWHMRYLDNPDPARTPKEVPHPAGVTHLAFRPPDGRWIATAAEDRFARVWDITTLATSDAIELPHGENVSQLAFSPDGSLLATGSSGRKVKVWGLDQPTALPTIVPYEGKVSSVAFRPNTGGPSPWMATASRYSVHLFNDLTGDERSASEAISRPRDDGKFLQIGFSQDGAWLASLSEDNSMTWHPVEGEGFGEPIALEGQRSAMALSVDGAWLATTRSEGSASGDEVWLSRWDLDAAGLPGETRLVVAPGRITQLAIGGRTKSGGPRWLAASGLGRTAWLWDLDRMALEPTPIRQEARVSALAFSPDGRWLVMGDWDDAAHVWDLGTPSGEPLPHRELPHEDAVRAVRFSPDGLWLATGSGDHRARLWSVRDGFIELLSLAHRDAVISVAFGPRSRWFATGSLDNLLRLLPLDRRQLHAAACRAAGRNLTRDEWAEFLPGQAYHPTCDLSAQ